MADVQADIAACLAILLQTFSGEGALGVLPMVDLALPAFVGPGGGAEADQGRE